MSRRSPDPRQLRLFDARAEAPRPLAPAAPPRPGPAEVGEARLSIASPARQQVTTLAARTLASRLDDHLGGRLGHLTLTANRSTMLSARPDGGGLLRLRVHWSFAQAPSELLAHLALLALTESPPRARARALREVRAFFARHQESSPRPLSRAGAAALRSQGRHHDLLAIRDEVNRQWFDGALELEIGWGRAGSRRRRRRGRFRSVRLGSFDADRGRIRIHPLLDHASVPRYVVASVVHHEMLHAVIPPQEVPGSRRRIHPPELRRREREHPDFEAAQEWLSKHLGRLLRC